MGKVPYEIVGESISHEWITDPIDSVGWESKGCFYFENIFDFYEIPELGSVVQIGCALGCSLQILHSKFGGRVFGVDPWNPLGHPLVIEKTIEEFAETDSDSIAFVHVNPGDFRSTSELRRFALKWALSNLVIGGVCLTAGNNERVEDLLGWKITDVCDEIGEEDGSCFLVENINDDIKARTDKKFTVSDCIITRKL